MAKTIAINSSQGRKHLDRIWPVLGVSGAQNRGFTSFFDTPWTFFAQNVAKVCYQGREIGVRAIRYWVFYVAHSTPGRIRGFLLGAACEGAT